VLFLMAGASRQQGDAILNLFYPDHDRFWLGLLPPQARQALTIAAKQKGQHRRHAGK
jgi:hypothetical protein